MSKHKIFVQPNRYFFLASSFMVLAIHFLLSILFLLPFSWSSFPFVFPFDLSSSLFFPYPFPSAKTLRSETPLALSSVLIGQKWDATTRRTGRAATSRHDAVPRGRRPGPRCVQLCLVLQHHGSAGCEWVVRGERAMIFGASRGGGIAVHCWDYKANKDRMRA